MITSGSSSLELKFEVFIHNNVVDYASIQKVSVELQENMHNLAVLEVAGVPSQYLTDYIDLPVSIRITVEKMWSHTFVGYISYLEPVSNNKDGLVNKSPFQFTKMYCLGATYPMRSRKTRAWENVTLSQIAKELSNKYNMTLSVPNDPYVFPRLVQSGESDWALLVKAVDYLGYKIMSIGTHLDIWDPFVSLHRNTTRPLYAMYGNMGDVKAKPGQVITFKAMAGAVTPTSAKVPDTIHALIGHDISTLRMDTNTGYGTPVSSIFEDEVPQNAVSIDMANAVIRGRSRKKLPIVAEVTAVCDPSIVPGSVVNLSRYESGLDGLWLVQSARHEMFRGSAMSYLTIAKDSIDEGNYGATYSSSPAPVVPEPTIKNNRWLATNELIHIY